jgi:hypothetical protein
MNTFRQIRNRGFMVAAAKQMVNLLRSRGPHPQAPAARDGPRIAVRGDHFRTRFADRLD